MRRLRGLLTFLILAALTLPAFAESLQIESPDFKSGDWIPQKHTCEGKNYSPALKWSRGPAGTHSYAILAEDPDAPGGIWTHWILYDLPPSVTNIPGGVPPILSLANAEKHGMNDFGNTGYGGPCPPSGIHEYHFRIFALNEVLSFDQPPKRQEFLKTIEGKVLAEGKLTGKYEKKKK